MAKNSIAYTLFEEIVEFSASYEENYNNALNHFQYYKDQEIILDCDFDDSKWFFSDQYTNLAMVFRFSKVSYEKHFHSIFDISMEEFVTNLKIYIMLMMGKIVLISLKEILNDVKKLIRIDYNSLSLDSVVLNKPDHLIEFINTLPSQNEIKKMELLTQIDNYIDNMYVSNSINRRNLAGFESYFKFNDYLNKYWNSTISDQERLFYYPVYLWWSITAIIPLRPREFILTPRDCLKIQKEQKYIILRRNRLKGRAKGIHYNIDKDYEKVMYPVTEHLWNEISRYISLTNGYDQNSIDTLFRTEPHYAMFNQSKRCDSRFYTYVNLSTCLELFYKNILAQNMHLNVIKESSSVSLNLSNKDIEYINLGDTRHIAMINIIAEGGNPSIAMQLAGHTSIDMSSHYYANISNLIECKTYIKYRSLLSNKSDYQMGTSYYPIINQEEFIEIEDGAKCYSPQFIIGHISDCANVVGENGEIGYCPRCQFYRKNNQPFFIEHDEIYKSKIEKDCTLLKDALNNYRKGIGYEEDIDAALLKLENSSNNYERYFLSNLLNKNEVTYHGQT